MMQEYGKKYEQGGVVLPILCVRDDGFDPETFLEASGMQWDQYSPLNRPPRQFSVLDFFDKIAKVVLEKRRSFQVSWH